MGRHARSQKGFTLLEVLVALAVMAIALTVLLRLVSGTLRLERAAHDRTRAVALAQARLAEVSLEDTPTSRAGEEAKFRWWVTAIPVWQAREGVHLYHVTVMVEGPGGRSLRLGTLRVGTTE